MSDVRNDSTGGPQGPRAAPATTPGIEALLQRWASWRVSTRPALAFVEPLLAAWRAVGQGDSAISGRAPNDELLTQWACSLLFKALLEAEAQVPWRTRVELLMTGVWSIDDALGDAKALAGTVRDWAAGPDEGVFFSVIKVADDGALDDVAKAFDDLGPGVVGAGVERDLIERLVRAGRPRDALARLARVDWPSERARALKTLAPSLSADELDREIGEAWRFAQTVSILEDRYRLGFFKELLALDDTPGRAGRVGELVRFVEGLPTSAWEWCQDHDHPAAIVAVALAHSGDVEGALAWAARIDGDWGYVSLAELAQALPEGPRDRLGLDALRQAEPPPGQEDNEGWWTHAFGHLALLSPRIAEACAVRAAAIDDSRERWLARGAILAAKGPAWPGWLDEGAHLLAELPESEEGDDQADAMLGALEALPDPAPQARALLEAVALWRLRRFDPYAASDLARLLPASAIGALLDAIEAALGRDPDWNERSQLVAGASALARRLSGAQGEGQEGTRARRLLSTHGASVDLGKALPLPEGERRRLAEEQLRRARSFVRPEWATNFLYQAWTLSPDLETPWLFRACADVLSKPERQGFVAELCAYDEAAQDMIVGWRDIGPWPSFVAWVIGRGGPVKPPEADDWRAVVRATSDTAGLVAFCDAQPEPLVRRVLSRLPDDALGALWGAVSGEGPGSRAWADALLDEVARRDWHERLEQPSAVGFRVRIAQRIRDAALANEQARLSGSDYAPPFAAEARGADRAGLQAIHDASWASRFSTNDGDHLAVARRWAEFGDRQAADEALGRVCFEPYRVRGAFDVALTLGDAEAVLASLRALASLGRPDLYILPAASDAAERGFVREALASAADADEAGDEALGLTLRAVVCAEGSEEGWAQSGVRRDEVLEQVEREARALSDRLDSASLDALYRAAPRLSPAALRALWERTFGADGRGATPLFGGHGQSPIALAARLAGPEIVPSMALVLARAIDEKATN